MHVILIWFDHLPYALPGCCGNTDAQTPGFDQFAAGAVTFDNCFVDDLRRDPAAGLIENLLHLQDHNVPVHVMSAESTHLIRQIQQNEDRAIAIEIFHDEDDLAERIVRAAEGVSSRVISLADEPDTAGEETVTVASMPGAVNGEGAVFTKRLKFADRLIERLARVSTGNQALLLVTAAAGCETTEHRGAPHERRIHVPLLGRCGPPMKYGSHSPSLAAMRDVLSAIVRWTKVEAIHPSAEVSSPAETLLQELAGTRTHARPSLIVRGRDEWVGVRTPHWYLTTRRCGLGATVGPQLEEDSVALYVKPDDLWECLDVASQWPGIVDDLIAMMQDGAENSGGEAENHR